MLARVNIYLSHEQYEYALNDINSLIKLEPENRILYSLAGDVHSAMENYGEAVVYYKSALEHLSEPTDRKNVYLAIGNCSFNMEQYENAVEYYSKYMESTTNNEEEAGKGEACFHRGVSYIQLAKYEKAVNDLTLAIEFAYQPELSAAFQRGLAYYMLERYEEAISDLEIYTSAFPDNSDPWIYLALSFYNIKDYDSAIIYFEKCINANLMLGESNYYLATIYLNKKQFNKAIEHYTASADLDYQTEYSLYNTGVAYLNLNKKEQAKNDFQQVVKITKKCNP
ncbi:MAG: tetratricopeptide repeat protein [Clostridiales bacterium]|nr:tetratricopeptide repeat protein [Clostridiales bacterium]